MPAEERKLAAEGASRCSGGGTPVARATSPRWGIRNSSRRRESCARGLARTVETLKREDSGLRKLRTGGIIGAPLQTRRDPHFHHLPRETRGFVDSARRRTPVTSFVRGFFFLSDKIEGTLFAIEAEHHLPQHHHHHRRVGW